MDNLSPPPLPEEAVCHAKADYESLTNSGTVVRTKAGENEVLSAAGSRSVDLLKRAGISKPLTHEVNGIIIAHGLAPVALTWGELGNYTVIALLILVAYVMIVTKIWMWLTAARGEAWLNKDDAEMKFQDADQREQLQEWIRKKEEKREKRKERWRWFWRLFRK